MNEHILSDFMGESYDLYKKVENLTKFLEEKLENFKAPFNEKVIYKEILDKLKT